MQQRHTKTNGDVFDDSEESPFYQGSPYGYDEDEEEGEQWGNGMGMGMDPMFQSQMMGLMQFASMMEQAMMGSFGSEMGGQFAPPQEYYQQAYGNQEDDYAPVPQSAPKQQAEPSFAAPHSYACVCVVTCRGYQKGKVPKRSETACEF